MILLLIFALLVAIATSRNAEFSFFSFASPPASFFFFFFSVTELICSFLFLIAWILSSLCFLGLFCMLLRW